MVNTVETGRDYVALVEEGSFTFDRVAPGEYYLALSHKEPRYDSRYPTAYYPNATTLGDATKISVKQGASVEDLTLHVGPERKGRRVAGVVVWPDGHESETLGLRIFADGEYQGWRPLGTTAKLTSYSTAILFTHWKRSMTVRKFWDSLNASRSKTEASRGSS